MIEQNSMINTIYVFSKQRLKRDVDEADSSSATAANEPHREKTGFLPRRKQRRRSASR